MSYRCDALVEQLASLGVRPAGVLVVHTSFRAVRARDPLTLIEALSQALGPDGTLVMPTMTDGRGFDPAVTPTLDMGITAELFWRQPGVLRSDHPGGSFAARGPAAAEICKPQPLSPPHGPDSPVGRAHAMGGQVLLLGVHHSENTTVHLAEAVAGVPYAVSYPTVVGDETVMIAETDHCCMGFRQLDGWLGDRQRQGKVGDADARLCDAADVVAVACAHLAAQPLIFLCPRASACDACDRARDSIAGTSR